MPSPDPMAAWMNAWLGSFRPTGSAAGNDAASRLFQYGQDYAGFAADYWRQFMASGSSPAGAGPAHAAGPLEALFQEHYRRLFTPTWPAELPIAGAATAVAAAVLRCQRALQALAQLAAAAAADGARRLAAELSRTDAAPITTLRELHDLWVDCGEAAWRQAAAQDAYAEAQAELLAALVELKFEQRRSQPPGAGSSP